MTRILTIGDVHVRDKPPANRHEGYLEEIIDLLTQCATLSEDTDAAVFAGDLFDFKLPSRTAHSTVLRMIEVINLMHNPHAIPGNHDISSDLLASVTEKQPLGVLFRSGLTELDGWHESLPVFGVPWQQRWLEPGTVWDAFTEWRSNPHGHDLAHSLVVTHAPVYPPSEAQNVIFELVPTSGPGSLSEAMGGQGSLYYGHIHEDHGVFTDGGVTFANVGAISRGSLTEYNMERTVQACVWDSETGFHPVPLVHAPAASVFKVAEAAAVKESKKNLDSFLAEVGGSTLDISSTASVIEHVQQRGDIEPRIKELTIEMIEAVDHG
jgi:hypothetical protein